MSDKVNAVDWLALIKSLAPYLQQILLQILGQLITPVNPLPPNVKKMLKDAGCPDSCCEDLCKSLCCQRDHLVQALVDNCHVSCCLSDHTHEE